MLTLPSDWNRSHTGHVVELLWQQITSIALGTSVARSLIWAHFDVLRTTLWRRGVGVAEADPLTWRVNDHTTHYVPVLDDELLSGTTVKALGPNDRLVVPVGQGMLARSALAAAFPRRTVLVSSLDELMGFRQTMTCGDTGWSGQRVTWFLLRLYNRRVRTLGEPLACRVSLPPASAAR